MKRVRNVVEPGSAEPGCAAPLPGAVCQARSASGTGAKRAVRFPAPPPRTLRTGTAPPARCADTAMTASSTLRFDRFELQPDERRLLRDGQEVPIRGRAFDVLAVLAQQPGRLVSKNELLERVWPGLVVEEGNIAAQIAAVRKALTGDLVATVPGHGYRLAIEPEHVIPAPAPAGPPAAGPQLFGRDDDLPRLHAALTQPGCVTLLGPGGVGKTALARAILPAGWLAAPPGWIWQRCLPASRSCRRCAGPWASSRPPATPGRRSRARWPAKGGCWCWTTRSIWPRRWPTSCCNWPRQRRARTCWSPARRRWPWPVSASNA